MIRLLFVHPSAQCVIGDYVRPAQFKPTRRTTIENKQDGSAVAMVRKYYRLVGGLQRRVELTDGLCQIRALRCGAVDSREAEEFDGQGAGFEQECARRTVAEAGGRIL